VVGPTPTATPQEDKTKPKRRFSPEELDYIRRLRCHRCHPRDLTWEEIHTEFGQKFGPGSRSLGSLQTVFYRKDQGYSMYIVIAQMTKDVTRRLT
jgi:hypothetical protein